MAQFLDLTGLGYFKNKLLSSALNYNYTYTDIDADTVAVNLSTDDVLFLGASTDLSSSGESWRSGFTTGEDTEWILYDKGSATLFSQDINNSYYQSVVTANPNHLQLGVLNGDSTPYYSTMDLDRNGIITIESSAENMNGDQDLYQNIAHLKVQTTDNNGIFELKAYTDGYFGSDPEWDPNTILITGDAANGLTIDSGNMDTIIKTEYGSISLRTPEGGNINLQASNGGAINLQGDSSVSISSPFDVYVTAQEMLEIKTNTNNTFSMTNGGDTTLTNTDGAINISSNNLNLTKTAASFNLGTGANHNFTVTANNFQVDSSGVVSKIRQLKGGNSYNSIYFGSDDISFSSNYGSVTLQQIINSCSTCFRGDTSYITMADGSKKLIQDVKAGDLVRGYDVNKKEYIEVAVLQNEKTGEERAFDCYVMDDGTTVDIFNNDGFICSLKLHQKDEYGDKDGDYLNLYSMKTLYSFHEKKDDQRRIIKDEGNLENTTCVIHKFTADCAHRTARYTLYTSNGTFFVNGLLHGLLGRSLPHFFYGRHLPVPNDVAKVFDEILLDTAERDENLPDTHIENPDKVGDLAILNKAKATIAWAKNKLAATDYKAMKYAEGALTEEEWLPIKQERAGYRQTVNDNEAIVIEYTEKVAKDNPAMLDNTGDIPDHIVKHNKWINHQKIYDDNYEAFKRWAMERKQLFENN